MGFFIAISIRGNIHVLVLLVSLPVSELLKCVCVCGGLWGEGTKLWSPRIRTVLHRQPPDQHIFDTDPSLVTMHYYMLSFQCDKKAKVMHLYILSDDLESYVAETLPGRKKKFFGKSLQ